LTTSSKGKSLKFDLYWSFRSPYCYLGTGRIVAITQTYDVTVEVHPVLPVELRIDGFFDRANPLFLSYADRDLRNIAAYRGIPFVWPVLDPEDQSVAAPGPATQQPVIRYLARLGVEAAAAGRGLEFFDEISRLIWSGCAERWYARGELEQAAARAGLDLGALERAVAADPAHFDQALAKNDDALRASGHWGTPTMVFEGEPFFGQDRIDLLVWRMQQRGLKRRAV
jgi:2-hydroxychromene-2-carboxylate isomerase